MSGPAPSWEDTCADCGAYIDSMNGEAVSGLRYGVALTWCSDECLDDWADKRVLTWGDLTSGNRGVTWWHPGQGIVAVLPPGASTRPPSSPLTETPVGSNE